MARVRSCFTQPIEQRPSKHERHEPAKEVADPKVTQGAEEVSAHVALRFQREDKQRDDGGSDKVEEKAWQGFEAEGAGGDAEERSCQGADVGDGLGNDC